MPFSAMSDAAVPAQSHTPEFKRASARSLPARMMAFFSGTNGLIAKIVLLAGFNALVVWAATVLATHEKWIPLLTNDTPVVPAELRNTAGIVGAAYAAKTGATP